MPARLLGSQVWPHHLSEQKNEGIRRGFVESVTMATAPFLRSRPAALVTAVGFESLAVPRWVQSLHARLDPFVGSRIGW
jgi:hypothetical protein